MKERREFVVNVVDCYNHTMDSALESLDEVYSYIRYSEGMDSTEDLHKYLIHECNKDGNRKWVFICPRYDYIVDEGIYRY